MSHYLVVAVFSAFVVGVVALFRLSVSFVFCMSLSICLYIYNLVSVFACFRVCMWASLSFAHNKCEARYRDVCRHHLEGKRSP